MKVHSYMVGGKIINSRAQYPWVQIMSTAHTSCKTTSLSLGNSTCFSSNEQRYKSLEADDMFREWKWCKEEKAPGGSSRKEGGEGRKRGKEKGRKEGQVHVGSSCSWRQTEIDMKNCWKTWDSRTKVGHFTQRETTKLVAVLFGAGKGWRSKRKGDCGDCPVEK